MLDIYALLMLQYCKANTYGWVDNVDSRRDKNGKTEQEFLRDYDVTKYFRPSVTVDAVLYAPTSDGARILYIKRGGHPFIGMYAFPGGFIEADESCEQAAARELYEETGVKDIALRQLITASHPDRDPRWRNITAVFCAEANGDIVATAGDDAADAQWLDVTCKPDGGMSFIGRTEKFECKLDIVRDSFGNVDINKTSVVERGDMAFDHAKLTYYLLDLIKRNLI